MKGLESLEVCKGLESLEVWNGLESLEGFEGARGLKTWILNIDWNNSFGLARSTAGRVGGFFVFFD